MSFELYHIFAYLKAHDSEMLFDPTPIQVDMTSFPKEDWSSLPYDKEKLTEELPAHMPKPLGPSMTMRVFVNSDHAGDMLTRRSRTGFIDGYYSGRACFCLWRQSVSPRQHH